MTKTFVWHISNLKGSFNLTKGSNSTYQKFVQFKLLKLQELFKNHTNNLSKWIFEILFKIANIFLPFITSLFFYPVYKKVVLQGIVLLITEDCDKLNRNHQFSILHFSNTLWWRSRSLSKTGNTIETDIFRKFFKRSI